MLVAVLAGVFVLGITLGVAGLLALGDPGVLVVCIVAALAGLLAAVLAWIAVRAALEQAADADAPPEGLPQPPMARAPRPVAPRPSTIQSLPVADLPEPYVAAVMKGLRASRGASGGREQR